MVWEKEASEESAESCVTFLGWFGGPSSSSNLHVLHSPWLAANILSYFFGWLLYNAGGPRARSLSPKNMEKYRYYSKKLI